MSPRNPKPGDAALAHVDLAFCAAVAADLAVGDLPRLLREGDKKAVAEAVDEANRYSRRTIEQLRQSRADLAGAMADLGIPFNPRRPRRPERRRR